MPADCQSRGATLKTAACRCPAQKLGTPLQLLHFGRWVLPAFDPCLAKCCAAVCFFFVDWVFWILNYSTVRYHAFSCTVTSLLP